ncbi:DUF11 domain-containing protein [Leptolyngbya sp. NIES-2104]|uniref:DUF11 domain-containing protein n=1 Tax=Leptolyngbya sp. NIES-2104 TaxID=1552121 RepID=UPI0006EC9841|nr:DUF11 domain-containing protein [Leptolyngbya sp. NIES-2104]GAP95486.1 hypothetical protein NIES2104_20080 [Leptolyngbya sp. NIES-2104]
MKRNFVWIGLGLAATVAMLPIDGAPAAARLFDRGLSIAQSLQQPKVELNLIAKQKVIQKDAQGKEQVSWNVLTKDTMVQKGTVLRFQVVAKNTGDRAAEKFVVTQPVPKGTTYAADSATSSGAELTYSIDGGKTFTANPMVQVTLPDGRTEMKPAPVEAYSHVRWTFEKAIAPKNALEVNYEVSVR